jgi:hypothetical protein
MAKRLIHIEFFAGGEPNEETLAEMKQAFADLGWILDFSIGGGSNVDRWGLSFTAEDSEMPYATLMAMFRRFGLPLDYCGPFLYGDVSMMRQSVDWPRVRGADVEDVHLETLDITVSGSFHWPDRLVLEAGVRCVVSPRGDPGLPPPSFWAVALDADDKPLSDWNAYSSGGSWGGTVLRLGSSGQLTPPVNLLVRIMDLHRAGEVVFRSALVPEKNVMEMIEKTKQIQCENERLGSGMKERIVGSWECVKSSPHDVPGAIYEFSREGKFKLIHHPPRVVDGRYELERIILKMHCSPAAEEQRVIRKLTDTALILETTASTMEFKKKK